MFRPIYKLYVRDGGREVEIDVRSIKKGEHIIFGKKEYPMVNLFDIDNLVFRNPIRNTPEFIDFLNSHGYQLSRYAKPIIRYNGKDPITNQPVVREVYLLFGNYPLLTYFAQFLDNSKSAKDLEKDETFLEFFNNFLHQTEDPQITDFLIKHGFIDGYDAEFVSKRCRLMLEIKKLRQEIVALNKKIEICEATGVYLSHEERALMEEQDEVIKKKKYKTEELNQPYTDESIKKSLFSYLNLRRVILGLDEYHKDLNRRVVIGSSEEHKNVSRSLVKNGTPPAYDLDTLSTADIHEMLADGRLSELDYQEIIERYEEKAKRDKDIRSGRTL